MASIFVPHLIMSWYYVVSSPALQRAFLINKITTSQPHTNIAPRPELYLDQPVNHPPGCSSKLPPHTYKVSRPVQSPILSCDEIVGPIHHRTSVSRIMPDIIILSPVRIIV